MTAGGHSSSHGPLGQADVQLTAGQSMGDIVPPPPFGAVVTVAKPQRCFFQPQRVAPIKISLLETFGNTSQEHFQLLLEAALGAVDQTHWCGHGCRPARLANYQRCRPYRCQANLVVGEVEPAGEYIVPVLAAKRKERCLVSEAQQQPTAVEDGFVEPH